MSSKENKKLAQQRRAEERLKQQRQQILNRVLVGIVVLCCVGFLVFMTVKDPGEKEKTDEATTEESTSSEVTTDVPDTTETTETAPNLDTTEGRVVEEGDTVAIDYEGKKDGVAFNGGTGSHDLTIGSGQFIEGFEEGLIGHTVGETVDLDLTFPENYGTEELAGEDVVFTVKINGIYDNSSEEE